MQRTTTLVITIALALVIPGAFGSGVSPIGPVTNGDFEHPFTGDTARETFEGTPIDECIGIGHQVLYGSESPQHALLDEEDPEEAVDRLDEEHIERQAGVGHCVWSEEAGYDYAWVHPVAKMNSPAGWSYDIRDPGVEFGYFFDGDALDREAKFFAGQGSNHNMWQSYASLHEAFTGNFVSFDLDVEVGTIPSNALVQISMSPNPLAEQSDRTFEPDCRLNFAGSLLIDHLDADGHVSVDPVDAQYVVPKGYEGCPSVEDWESADNDEKRALLGQLRLVQISFWSWNNGNGDVVVDNVALPGATTLAEEAVTGNVG